VTFFSTIKKNWKEVVATTFTISLFVAISYILQQNVILLDDIMTSGFAGIMVYIGFGILATVFAPVTSVPLLPVAVHLWGWIPAAIFSVIGWWIGSVIAFILARIIGIKFVQKFVSIEKIKEYENLIPTTHIFWGIVVIRILLPVDTISYILGLFSRINIYIYSAATFVGIIPMAFVLAYLGSLPFEYQLIGLVVFVIGFVFVLYFMKQYINMRKRESKKQQNSTLE